jgi:thiosulfate dehydrogenase [quinone] large subunit
MNTANDAACAHGLARLGLGINIALHGFTRLPDLAGFAAGLKQTFAPSILPPDLVYASGYAIAIGEATLGVLLILGWFLRPALVAGTLLMIFLLAGVCLVQNWAAAGIQMPYLAFYCVLLATMKHDWFSIDHWRARRP